MKTRNGRNSAEAKEQALVISEYFNKNNEMDDSLADFQESKKKCTKPKEAKKPAAKRQPKRTVRKEKGQKDIRTALKLKNDDLVSYSTKFRDICLESGVDVDPEQLQIAIALSKSLQDLEKEPQPSTSNSQKLVETTSQDRNTKIRTTLLEYGFKVPEIKRSLTRRRVRKYTKNSQLLITSEEEKRQKVADKVSQILFELPNDYTNVSIRANHSIHSENSRLIFQLTGQTFEHLKNEKCFYINDLFEFSENTMGCLLKDWSKIPGRPVSPAPKMLNKVHFTHYVNSTEDLDVLLSSTMKHVNKLVQASISCNQIKSKLIEANEHVESIYEYDENVIPKDIEIGCIEYNPLESSTVLITTVMPKIVRSVSPDLFDEDQSLEEISIRSKEPALEPIKETNGFDEILPATNEVSGSTDLTVCDNALFKPKYAAQASHKTIQEMTGTNSPILDLTQSSESSQDSLPYIQLSSATPTKMTSGDLIMLSSEGNVEIQIADDNLLSKCNENDNSNGDKTIKSFNSKNNGNDIDLTEDSHSPVINDQILENKKGTFDDFIYQHSSISDTSSNKEEPNKNDADINDTRSNNFMEENELHVSENYIDLTQSFNYHGEDHVENDYNSEVSHVNMVQNYAAEVVDNICIDSGNKSEMDNDENRTLEYDVSYNFALKGKASHDMVTNEKDCSIIVCDESRNEEFIDECNIIEHDASQYHLPENEELLSKHVSDNSKDNDFARDEQNINSSQCSDVFEISDEELDYSMQYFKTCKPDTPDKRSYEQNNSKLNVHQSCLLEETSASSNLPATTHALPQNINACIRNKRSSFNDSLPAVEIKGTKVKIKSPKQKIAPTCASTPIQEMRSRDLREQCNIATPSGYIIKTTNVTPMLDYASLDTPVRNKELEKYGIRPFKRKRAVQLLEYLYCQTHPIVEKCDPEVTETPTKIQKLQSVDPAPHSTQLDVIPNAFENKDKVEEIESVDNSKIYEAKNVKPVLKNIPCVAEEWIFQKREKAKVRGCRVPLHVAFHNYVSARPLLRESILRYEPISIDIVHKQLAKDGHRYDPKDLLKYLDRRCITVKTADSGRNTNRRSQRSS